MDKIDIALFEAWDRVAALCRADPAEAMRRFRRARLSSFTRPPRAWCLCIRASDTRLPSVAAVIPDPDGPPMDDVEYAVNLALPHSLHITGSAIRQLTRPVEIPWPGIDWTRAAARLGQHPEMLRSWITRRALRVESRRPARSVGKRGKPVPFVWAPSPLDPNSPLGRAPDPVWGALWQSLWERFPEDYELIVRRVPVLRPYAVRHRTRRLHDPSDIRGRDRDVNVQGRDATFRGRGWRFVCPGRIDGSPCGRHVARLFAPQSVWTLPRALGDSSGFSVSAASPLPLGMAVESPSKGDSTGESRSLSEISNLKSRIALSPPPPLRLTGSWHPIAFDPSTATGPRSFACQHCWRVRYLSLASSEGWNQFVSYISAGLLQGRDVPRPLAEVPFRRKRAYRPSRNRAPSRRRAQVLQLLLQGLTSKEIAARLRVGYGTVIRHVSILYRKHNVHTRAQLARALGHPLVTSSCRRRDRSRRVAARRRKVDRLFRDGLSYKQIAARLNVSYNIVHKDITAFRRASRVAVLLPSSCSKVTAC